MSKVTLRSQAAAPMRKRPKIRPCSTLISLSACSGRCGGRGTCRGCYVDFLVYLLLRALGRKRSSPRVLSAVGRRPELKDAPSRIACNGACATASLYTMQGKKGVNQDAMVVMEVYQLSSSSCLYFIPLLCSFHMYLCLIWNSYYTCSRSICSFI